MRRIGVYPTLDASGEPTAVGSYFDPFPLSDFDLEPGINQTASILRDGTIALVSDSKQVFPIRGTLTISSRYVDLESGTTYLGNTIYLIPTFCDIMSGNESIIIFQNSSDKGKNCFKCKLMQGGQFDNVAYSSGCNIPITEPSGLMRNSLPDVFTFGLIVLLDGTYTDIDDVLSASWNSRI